MMHKLILAAAISAVFAGCASHGGSTGRSEYDESAPQYDHRYWPPVVPGQAFPPQIMDGET